MKRSRSSDTFRSRKEEIAPPEGDRFCQSFIKPTQIYRYLRTRFRASPLFLHRNLSYMKGNSVRKRGPTRQEKREALSIELNKKRENNEAFSFDKQKNKKEAIKSNENLVIGFLHFENDKNEDNNMKVQVTTKLEKTSHKRRKEGTMEPNEEVIGNSTVEVNSKIQENLPAVCVTNDKFQLGDNIQTTFSLTFDIVANGQFPQVTGDTNTKKACIDGKRYCAQLPVLDKHGRNLLLPGIYQITAFDPQRGKQSHKSNWEARTESWVEEVNKHWVPTDDGELANPFLKFENTAKIVLYLEWRDSTQSNLQFIKKPKFISDHYNNNNKENAPRINGNDSDEAKPKEPEVVTKADPSAERYIFQFIVNQSIKQRMEERSDFVCPWCSVNCIRMYSLMKHLKLCHARFVFQYIEESPVRRIDVYVNELYDGSYSGAPHDVILGGSKGNPTRRNVATSNMVFKPRKPTFKMSEFAENDDNDLETRQYFIGHNRIYYHSETCIPILPKELDYDSEGEPNPSWLQRTTKQMIDEFTDVNGGEKELMKLWNLHVMKHGFVGDCQIDVACDLFLKEHGKDMIEKNLFRNFLIHLDSLLGFGLISPRTSYKMQILTIKLQYDNFDKEAEEEKRRENVRQWNSKAENKTSLTKSLPIVSKSSGKPRTSRP